MIPKHVYWDKRVNPFGWDGTIALWSYEENIQNAERALAFGDFFHGAAFPKHEPCPSVTMYEHLSRIGLHKSIINGGD